MTKLVEVALKISHNNGVFTYSLPKNSPNNLLGRRVKVNFKNKETMGVIINDDPKYTQEINFNIKPIIEIIDSEPIIDKNQFDLMRFCAKYYFNPLGITAHLFVPRNNKTPKQISITKTKPCTVELNAEQEQIVQRIITDSFNAFLLEGITGSGKTHVYIEVAKHYLSLKKSILFIVPEISLTPQLITKVESYLGQKALVMHSNISPAKKRDTINALNKHEGQILIGARSSIFAPLKDLGLIVVDEEHDSSLKQDESPQYHARDLALWRAHYSKAKIILGSATPSLESIVNSQKNKLIHLKLTSRFNSKKLPQIEIIDLKARHQDVDHRTKDISISHGQKMCILSRPLVEEMRKTIAQKAQVLLFLNHRGYARFGVCNACGKLVSCPNCSVSLTYYLNKRSLTCHQCKHTEVKTTICHHCHKDSVVFLGLGTERLEQEVKEQFEDAHVVRIDRDITTSQSRLESALAAVHHQQADILIGTQMIAKGHDFLHVSLVGVVLADISLSMPDFRAAEKTFQLLTQVSGRAGRGSVPGKAMIQTFNPSAPSIHFAKTHDVSGFVLQELKLRKNFNIPPYTKAALIRIEHKSSDVAQKVIAMAQSIVKQRDITILGPAPSPIEKINLRFRFQMLLIADSHQTLHRTLKSLNSHKEFIAMVTKSNCRFLIDVDPQQMS